MEPKDFVGVLCWCVFVDTQAKLKSDNENAFKESFKVRNHIAREEACSIEVIQVEFIKTCSVGIPMHVMSGAQSWIIRLVSLYEKHNPDKNFKCTWRIILKSLLT